MTSVWLIEYTDYGARPCWIADLVRHHSFGVTFNPLLARRFTNAEDARNAILKLGLASTWKAVEHYLPS